MDDEFRKQLADRFDPDELVDLLELTTSQLIEACYDIITEREEFLHEFIRHGR